VAVRRVRKAYEQVADQLRELIVAGDIAPSERLPNEARLAAQFGVSRPTIREALRVLSAQSLIRTTKGATGGSFVTVPTAQHISELVSSNMSLLSNSEDVSLDDFLEARELLEVPAVRLAARRRSEADLNDLRAAIPDRPLALAREELFVHNRDFHTALVLASGNTLLSIAAQPVFAVLQTNLKRSPLGASMPERITEDHRAMVAAVESGDEAGAAEQMREHLTLLRPMYEEAWRFARRRRS
jgi:GntR family transcriptional repressor for pyruvate dehydrogenase complex